MRANPTENRLLAKLPANELHAITEELEPVELTYSQMLIAPHEPIRHAYFPVTALASLVTVLEDGGAIECGAVGREGMVGVPILLNAVSTPMQTVAQIPGLAYRAPAGAVKALFERRGTFFDLINRYVHTLFVVASQSSACNRRHQVGARLARWLLMSSDGIGSSDVGITHEYLAVMLGVRRPGVTEAAVKLQSEGLIQYSRGNVRIVDRPGLERAACECYRTVRDEYERLLG
jgi:CRP-like cAMP-binding protein